MATTLRPLRPLPVLRADLRAATQALQAMGIQLAYLPERVPTMSRSCLESCLAWATTTIETVVERISPI